MKAQISKLKHKNLLPKSKIFENDGNDIQFENQNSEEEDIFTEQKPRDKEAYTSNFDLIPENEFTYHDTDDDTLENL